MARQVIKSYAIDPAHTNDSHAIDQARSNGLRIVSVCDGYKRAYLLDRDPCDPGHDQDHFAVCKVGIIFYQSTYILYVFLWIMHETSS